MKKYINLLFTMIIMGLLFVSCEEETDYTSKLFKGAAPTVTISVQNDSIVDDGTYISVSSNQDGKIFWAVAETGTDAPAQGYEIVLAEYSSVKNGNLAVVANTAVLIKINKLSEGVSYDVYAVSTNGEGQNSAVSAAQTFITTDHIAPKLTSVYPANNSVNIDSTVMLSLTFDENVTYVEGKTITIFNYADDSKFQTITSSDSVTVTGNVVTLLNNPLEIQSPYYVVVEEGAFVDVSGNVSGEIFTDAVANLVFTFTTGPVFLDDQFVDAYLCQEFSPVYGAAEYYVIIFPDGGNDGWRGIGNYLTSWGGFEVWSFFDAVNETLEVEEETLLYTSGTGYDYVLFNGDYYPGGYFANPVSSYNLEDESFIQYVSIRRTNDGGATWGLRDMLEITFTKARVKASQISTQSNINYSRFENDNGEDLVIKK